MTFSFGVASPRPRLRTLFRSDAAKLAITLLLGSALLALLTPSFLSEFNAYVVMRGVAVTLLAALAQLVVLAIGQMNLAVGAIGGMVAILTGGMMELWGFPTPLAIGLGLAVGIGTGMINGLLITRTGINGFVITLATASAFTGITIGLNNAQPFYNLPAGYVAFGQARIGPVPLLGLVTAVIVLLVALLFNRMVLGRQILAVGGNARSATLSGIPVDRVVITVHVLSGLLSAIAAILLMARLGSAQPSIGSDWLLPSFAIPIVGGIALNGGTAPVGAAVLAAFLIALIENGLVLTKADPYWIQFLLGAIILGAVGLNRLQPRDDGPRS